MTEIHIGDLVTNIGDRTVIGEVVLANSPADGGLHPAADIDVWDTGDGLRFSDSGLVPVRWNTDDRTLPMVGKTRSSCRWSDRHSNAGSSPSTERSCTATCFR